MAPLDSMTSGTRNDPPISTSSPLDTITSFPLANVSRQIRTAAALLFTTTASSAPVISVSTSFKWEYLLPRFPFAISYSRLEYPAAIAVMFSRALSDNADLPRFVWMTTPVALMSGFNLYAESLLIEDSISPESASSETSGSLPSRISLRFASMVSLIARSTVFRLYDFSQFRPY